MRVCAVMAVALYSDVLVVQLPSCIYFFQLHESYIKATWVTQYGLAFACFLLTVHLLYARES